MGGEGRASGLETLGQAGAGRGCLPSEEAPGPQESGGSRAPCPSRWPALACAGRSLSERGAAPAPAVPPRPHARFPCSPTRGRLPTGSFWGCGPRGWGQTGSGGPAPRGGKGPRVRSRLRGPLATRGGRLPGAARGSADRTPRPLQRGHPQSPWGTEGGVPFAGVRTPRGRGAVLRDIVWRVSRTSGTPLGRTLPVPSRGRVPMAWPPLGER